MITRAVLGLFYFGFWILLVGYLSWPEAALGALCAIAGVGMAYALRAAKFGSVRVGSAAIRFFLKGPMRFVSESVDVLREVFARRGRRAQFRLLTLAPTGSDPPARTRRALLLFAASFFPNTVSIGMEPGDGDMLVHELKPDGEVVP